MIHNTTFLRNNYGRDVKTLKIHWSINKICFCSSSWNFEMEHWADSSSKIWEQHNLGWLKKKDSIWRFWISFKSQRCSFCSMTDKCCTDYGPFICIIGVARVRKQLQTSCFYSHDDNIYGNVPPVSAALVWSTVNRTEQLFPIIRDLSLSWWCWCLRDLLREGC